MAERCSRGGGSTEYLEPLLFITDGSYLEGFSRDPHLGGDRWGMINETGNHPGQAWVWLYTFGYQVKPFSTSGNADTLVWGLGVLFGAIFVFIPFIPGLQSVPKVLPVHRLIWRRYSREFEKPAS